jgi:hypothetical protein
MSLFRGTLRPPAILSDEAVERYLAAIREELAPDPLFRRRLRGEVMNRYVAAREGRVATPRTRSMGKLGRAVLYASFTLALSATSVLAASQEALPGDLLYPLKREVETLRMEVLPAHLHHDLAAYELAERIDELARLTELGDVPRAAALAAVVAKDYEAFVQEADAAGIVADDRYLTVLIALLERLPEPAQEAVQAVIDRAPASGGGSSAGNGSTGSSDATTGNASSGNGAALPGAPNANGDGPDDSSSPAPTPKPTKSPKPEPTTRATPEPSASDDRAHGGGEVRGSGSDQDEPKDEDQGNQ